jgi:phosphatidylserine/phosphatidylglycerophosphate/cardiolipin synthase-like enzyme
MARAFAAMWERAHHRRWRRPPRVHPPAPDHVEHPAPAARVAIVEGSPLRFRVARAFQLHALTARRTIWIADAYFMPNYGELETLIGAARDGVDVRLLVPSNSDHSWMLRVTRRYYRRLLHAGVRVFEWKGAMMHAKTTVIDGHLTRVGSTDFNPLGMGINYELDAVIEDPTLGAHAEAMFLEDVERSREMVRRRPPR